MMAWAWRSVNSNWRDQTVAGFARRGRGADQLDDRVQIFERLLEAEQDVLALARLAQQVIGAAAYNVDAMIDEAPQYISESEFARLPVDDGQHDHAEVDLELGVLVEIVENDLGLFAALQLEDDAHAVAIAFVADFGDALDLLLVDQAGGGLDETRLVHLVGDFGDDDGFAVLADLFGGGFGAQLQRAAALGEVVENALAAEDESAGWEIGALHQVHDLAEMRVGLLNQKNGGVEDLVDIVRRDVGRHADCDPGRAVDQQVGDARGQDFGLNAPFVEIGPEIDSFLVQIFEQRSIDAGESRASVYR